MATLPARVTRNPTRSADAIPASPRPTAIPSSASAPPMPKNMPNGWGHGTARHTACLPRPNGNTLAVPAPNSPASGATTAKARPDSPMWATFPWRENARQNPTPTRTSSTTTAFRSPRPSGLFCQTLGACSICSAMSGSGWPMIGTKPLKARRALAPREQPQVVPGSASCAAVLGSAILGASAPGPGSGATTGARIPASGWPERCDVFNLRLFASFVLTGRSPVNFEILGWYMIKRLFDAITF